MCEDLLCVYDRIKSVVVIYHTTYWRSHASVFRVKRNVIIKYSTDCVLVHHRTFEIN